MMKSTKKKTKKFFVLERVVEIYMAEFIEDFEQVKKYLNRVYCLDINKVLKIEEAVNKRGRRGRDVFFQ